jgi:hypothetical protein
VIYTPFNRQGMPGDWAPVPKTSRHMGPGRLGWCRGSQLSVPVSTLVPTKHAKAGA